MEPNVIYADMPTRIKAYTIRSANGTYTIVLNSRLTREQHLISYHHEMYHIENGDYDRTDTNINAIEINAHKE